MYAKLFLICFNSGFVNKSNHKYLDRSGPFSQIMSHITNMYMIIADMQHYSTNNWSLIMN